MRMLRSRYSGQRAAVAAAKNATLPPEGLAPVDAPARSLFLGNM
jgi:hypothetical protein